MNFAEVTDVVIPVGSQNKSVAKITETSTGRVLWEKGIKISPHWLVTKSIIVSSNIGSQPVVGLSSVLSSDGLYSDGLKTVIQEHETSGVVETAPNLSWRAGIDIVKIGSNGGDAPASYVFYAISKPCNPERYLVRQSNTSEYYLNKTYNQRTLKLTTAPISNTSVKITISPERNEMLISGLSAGLGVMPTDFSSGYTMEYQSGRNFSRTCWAAGIGASGLYFGVTGTNKDVSYSVDGKNWSTSTALSSGNVLGVEYLNQKKKVCAISSNTKKLAISSDGINWEQRDTPTNKAVAYCYSPEYDVLCVFDNTGAYMTKNFTSWKYLAFPSSLGATLTDVVYYRKGVFVGYEYGNDRLYFLSIHYPIQCIASSSSILYQE